MIVQKQDTFVAFVDGEVDFENPWVFMVQNCQSSPSLPELVVREIYKKPWNPSIPGVQKSWFPVPLASSINQKMGKPRGHIYIYMFVGEIQIKLSLRLVLLICTWKSSFRINPTLILINSPFHSWLKHVEKCVVLIKSQLFFKLRSLSHVKSPCVGSILQLPAGRPSARWRSADFAVAELVEVACAAANGGVGAAQCRAATKVGAGGSPWLLQWESCSIVFGGPHFFGKLQGVKMMEIGFLDGIWNACWVMNSWNCVGFWMILIDG